MDLSRVKERVVNIIKKVFYETLKELIKINYEIKILLRKTLNPKASELLEMQTVLRESKLVVLNVLLSFNTVTNCPLDYF